MLDYLRKRASSWLVTLIIGAIIVVFVLWGIGTFRSPQFQKVAMVNGSPIYVPQYFKAYQNLWRSYQERFGSDFNEETAKALNLREQALSQLIDQLLLRQAARDLGLQVTDAELRDHIRRYPAFSDGQGFNEKRYYQILARMRLPASDFEAQERQQLQLQKVASFITAFAKVTEDELAEACRQQEEAVRVEYLLLEPKLFLARQQVTKEEVQNYYQQNQERWREPARVRFQFVHLKYQEAQAQLRPTREQLEDYYYQHLEDFTQPQKIRVSQLTLELGVKAGAAERQRGRQVMEKLQRRAQAGEPLEQLAQTPEAGGPLKFQQLYEVRRGQNPPTWEAVAFKLQKGEVVLVETPSGWQLLRLEEVLETGTPPFSAVQTQVEQAWRQQEAKAQVRQQAETLRMEMLTGSVAKAAAKARLKVQETPWLTPQEPLPGLGRQPQVVEAALALKPQEFSKPLEVADGIVLFQVLERRDSTLPPLVQIEGKVAEALKLEKAQQTAATEAANLLARLQQGETLAKVAASLKLPVQDSGFFTRSQGFPGRPQAVSLTAAAFALSQSKPIAKEVLTQQGSSYLLVFKDRRLPTPERCAALRKELEPRLLELKRQLIFSQWLAQQRQRAKIKIYELPS